MNEPTPILHSIMFFLNTAGTRYLSSSSHDTGNEQEMHFAVSKERAFKKSIAKKTSLPPPLSRGTKPPRTTALGGEKNVSPRKVNMKESELFSRQHNQSNKSTDSTRRRLVFPRCTCGRFERDETWSDSETELCFRRCTRGFVCEVLASDSIAGDSGRVQHGMNFSFVAACHAYLTCVRFR